MTPVARHALRVRELRAARAARSRYHRHVLDAKSVVIREALEACHDNRTYAADYLGIQRTYLLRLMRELRIS